MLVGFFESKFADCIKGVHLHSPHGSLNKKGVYYELVSSVGFLDRVDVT